MKFFGVHIQDLESEKFLSASNDQIASWLFLHAFCSKQMNGGTIPGAASLPERFWSRHGISVDIITKSSPLWSWSGDELTVEPYDIDGETLFAKKVKGGKEGAAKRWKGSENRSPNGSPNAPNLTRPNPRLPDLTLTMTDADASCPRADVVGDLWKIFPKLGKERSSRKKSLDAWAKIKAADRPPLDVVTTALRGWIECDQWKKDSGQFVPGLHKWITERKWEDVPSPSKATQNKTTIEELMGGRKLSITKVDPNQQYEPEPHDDDPCPL